MASAVPSAGGPVARIARSHTVGRRRGQVQLRKRHVLEVHAFGDLLPDVSTAGRTSIPRKKSRNSLTADERGLSYLHFTHFLQLRILLQLYYFGDFHSELKPSQPQFLAVADIGP